MGLDEFKKEEKTSSPSKTLGPSKKGVEKFLHNQGKSEIEIEGGFTIPNEKYTQRDTEVVKIFGGPGTGKTTTMVGNTDIDDFKGILQRMFETRRPEEVMLIAYTRAAADEAKNRLVELTDVTKSKADDRVTTIHSLAMRFNSLKPQDIVEIRWSNDKYDFCDQVGLEYNMNADSQEDMMATPDDNGHLFFRMLSWLKSKLKAPKQYEDCPLSSSWELGQKKFVELAEKWDEYKTDEGIWEFDDAILECVNNGDTIDTEYLFVDEVQDLYPLQQAFLDNQFGHVKRIFLAGDDDQTIYEWAGAKPEYFLDMEGNINEEIPELWDDKTGYWEDEGVYILDQSWRMPNSILDLAKMCIHQVDNRQEKQIKPHHEGGEFIPLRNPKSETVIELINPEDTMILFRAKYQMQNFGQELIEHGIPFKDRFKTWRDSMLAIRDGISALKNEEDTMTGYQAQRLAKELPKGAFDDPSKRSTLTNRFSKVDTVSCDDFLSYFRYNPPTNYNMLSRWCSEFRSSRKRNEALNYYQQEAIRNNLLNHNEHMTPEGIQLETIHSSKGREADTIILSTDTTKSVQENMNGDQIDDAERRLYYVGMTRSKNRLVMCQGLDSDSPTLQIDTLLGTEWREHYDWANSVVGDRVMSD